MRDAFSTYEFRRRTCPVGSRGASVYGLERLNSTQQRGPGMGFLLFWKRRQEMRVSLFIHLLIHSFAYSFITQPITDHNYEQEGIVQVPGEYEP